MRLRLRLRQALPGLCLGARLRQALWGLCLRKGRDKGRGDKGPGEDGAVAGDSKEHWRIFLAVHLQEGRATGKGKGKSSPSQVPGGHQGPSTMTLELFTQMTLELFAPIIHNCTCLYLSVAMCLLLCRDYQWYIQSGLPLCHDHQWCVPPTTPVLSYPVPVHLYFLSIFLLAATCTRFYLLNFYLLYSHRDINQRPGENLP